MNAFEKIKSEIQSGKSFVLEAGAGSGKTFCLIQTLNYVLQLKGNSLRFDNKRIVCITYTNVAKNEIIDRIEFHPSVLVLTIHEFLWASISNYQKQLVIELDILNESMSKNNPEKFFPSLLERTSLKEVVYTDSGYRDFENGSLHHDDVVLLAASLFEKYPTLTKILADKYPYIFIDEYQDTAPETIKSFLDFLLERNNENLILGFFGDSHQKIYDGGVGDLNTYLAKGQLTLIPKEENYRSSQNVINLLNNIRTNIKQIQPEDKTIPAGSVTFVNCNNYPAKPKKGIRAYEESLLPVKNTNYDNVISMLSKKGWDFSEKSRDKILILTNSRVAERAGFSELYKIFSTRYGEGANDQLLKRGNVLVRYFLGALDKKTSKERKSGVEHLMTFWENREYSNVVNYLNAYGGRKAGMDSHFVLKYHSDKKRISKKLDELHELRIHGTVKDVFEFIVNNQIVTLQEGIAKYLTRIQTPIPDDIETEKKERLQRDLALYSSVMELPYLQFINTFKHTQNETVFSTKHSTKGDEYRNVLVVLDDTSWKQKYNFQDFINGNDEDQDRTTRTRNLFYVSCSRAIENLFVLSLSEMSEKTMGVLVAWFNKSNVFNVGDLPQ